MHRACDVLEFLFASVFKGNLQLTLHLFLHPARNADPTGLGQCFQACGYVDTVAPEVITMYDQLAKIYAHAELDPLFEVHFGIALMHAALISTAQLTASMTLPNSTRIPSPTTLTILPRCFLIVGSIRLLQCAFHWASDPSSSAPTSRLYPATSAAKMVTSCRFTPSLAKTSSEVPRGPSYRIRIKDTIGTSLGLFMLE